MDHEFTGDMTMLSRQAFGSAASADLSAGEAAELLRVVPARTFAEILAKYAPEAGRRENLTNGLCADDPSRNRDSIDKKVRGWLNGKYQPTAREDLLELCFVLKLTADQADGFLAAAGEEGLHWRDPKELIYAFALRKGMRYPEAVSLAGCVTLRGTNAPETGREPFTAVIRQEAAMLETEEELKQYLQDAEERLGAYHNTAYRQLTEYLALLEQPRAVSAGEEESFTIRRIVETYLDSHFPSDWDRKKLDEKRREILAGWPDEVTLSRMKTGKTDVNRKTLILLFLATDGGDEITDDWEEDVYWDETEDENDSDADFRSSYIRLNRMLSTCGYRMLDPRNPFDWVVIYCMRVSSDPEAMEGLNERLSDMLDVLFPASGPETE